MHLLIKPRVAGCAPLVAAVALLALAPSERSSATLAPARQIAIPFVPGRLIIGHQAPVDGEQLIRLPRGTSVQATAVRIRRQPGIAYAVPDYIAHAAGTAPATRNVWIPNDPGRAHEAGGWQRLQWNFLAGSGVNAPAAWAHLRAVRRPGGKGVVIAVLDTGVAYRNWHGFRRSPDFKGTRFDDPCDLVAGKIKHGKCTDPYPLDRENHGTFVAGVIAEATNNHIGMTGLAYGASIMPVRILGRNGDGDASTIARGIRYAVKHGAQVINLSLQFSQGLSSSYIPGILAAIRYAHQRGVVVVAAAGNDYGQPIAYPARAHATISVGATTLDRCVADYSNIGTGLDLVAPGGGDDSSSTSDPFCHWNRNLPYVYQMTFQDSEHVGRFGFPSGWYGTSMATPEVSAAAAMVIASGVIGRHPTPDEILTRLERTAQPLGKNSPNPDYGHGLLDVGAATDKSVK